MVRRGAMTDMPLITAVASTASEDRQKGGDEGVSSPLCHHNLMRELELMLDSDGVSHQ